MNYSSLGRRVVYAEIKLLLDYSQRIYQEYLASKKKFIYASVLRKVNAKLYLSNEVSKIEDNSYETIFLPDQNSSIDLTKTLIEILIVEKPLKNLCFSLCKGLCSSCGKNLNHETCSCIK